MPNNSDLCRMIVQDVTIGRQQEDYYPVKLRTNRDYVHYRYYQVAGAQHGMICVGGVGGGWDTPAQGLYPRLCTELMSEAIASLRVRFRYPTQLEEAVFDVLAGLSYLQDEGINSVALIGHSFGGAVVIQAAAQAQIVRTVVTLATQSYGADLASELATRCSLLLLHGTDDPVLSPYCSQYVYSLALEPKRLIIYPGASHSLNEVAEETHQVVRDWVIEQFTFKK